MNLRILLAYLFSADWVEILTASQRRIKSLTPKEHVVIEMFQIDPELATFFKETPFCCRDILPPQSNQHRSTEDLTIRRAA